MKLLDSTPLSKLLNLETRRLEQLLLDQNLGRPLVTPRIATKPPKNARKALFFLMVFDPLNRCHFVAADPMITAVNGHSQALQTLRSNASIWKELLKDVMQLTLSPTTMVAEFFTQGERTEFGASHTDLNKNPDRLSLADIYASQRFPEKSNDIPIELDLRWQAQTILNVAFCEQWLLGTDTHFSTLVNGFGATDNQSQAVTAYEAAVKRKYIVWRVDLSLPGTYLGQFLFYVDNKWSSAQTSAAGTWIKGEAERFIAPLRIFHAMRAASYLEISNGTKTRTPDQVERAVQCMFGRVPTTETTEALRQVVLQIKDPISSVCVRYPVKTALFAGIAKEAELEIFEELVVWQLDVASQAQVSGATKTHRQQLCEKFKNWINTGTLPNKRSQNHEAEYLIPTILLIHLIELDLENLTAPFELKISKIKTGDWYKHWAKKLKYEKVDLHHAIVVRFDAMKELFGQEHVVFKFEIAGKLQDLTLTNISKNPSQVFSLIEGSVVKDRLVKEFKDMAIEFDCAKEGLSFKKMT